MQMESVKFDEFIIQNLIFKKRNAILRQIKGEQARNEKGVFCIENAIASYYVQFLNVKLEKKENPLTVVAAIFVAPLGIKRVVNDFYIIKYQNNDKDFFVFDQRNPAESKYTTKESGGQIKKILSSAAKQYNQANGEYPQSFAPRKKSTSASKKEE